MVEGTVTLSTAAPKPPKTEPKQRKELKRSSPVARSQKAIPKINVKAKAKRAIKARKHYASKAYRDAKNVAHARANGQCEGIHAICIAANLMRVFLPGEAIPSIYEPPRRCPMTTTLQFHETEYGSDLGIIREIDGFILCEGDHGYIERTRHPTRTNGR